MKFSELFQGFTGQHGRFIVTGKREDGKLKGNVETVNGYPGKDDWKHHLKGDGPGLGTIPILDDGKNVRWACIDIDIYDGIDHAKISSRLHDAKIKHVVTKSKSGGAHIWFFFKVPVLAKIAKIKTSQIAAMLGFSSAEVFPKQSSRLNRGDSGNWVNLPYFGDTRKAVINGKEAPLEEFLTVAELSMYATEKEFRELPTGQGKDFADGPPCLQALAYRGEIVSGVRNEVMHEVCKYAQMKDKNAMDRFVLDFNSALSDPLPSVEIQKIIKSVSNNNYYFCCQKEPMHSYCNRPECMLREFGIGKFEGLPLQGITIQQIDLYKTDPELFVLEIINSEGNIERLQLKNGVEDFTSQINMRRICLSKLGVWPPQVTRAIWDKFIQELCQSINRITVPFDCTPEGQFREHVKEFITRRMLPEEDAIANDNVYVNTSEQSFYFTIFSLERYLQREGFREASRPQCVGFLRNMGATTEHDKRKIIVKGRTYELWKLEGIMIQSEPFDVRSFQEPY